MLRLVTCQLCMRCRPTPLLKAFSTSKIIRFREPSAVQKAVVDHVEGTRSSSAEYRHKPFGVLKGKETATAGQDEEIEEEEIKTPKKKVPPLSLPLVSKASSSDSPLKLLNAVSPKFLSDAAVKVHQLDYSKLPVYYLGLSKSRLTGLVVVTAMAGYAMAPGAFAMLPFASLTIGTMLTSASANTINQIMEVEFDSQMDRTKYRVLVQRYLSMNHAAAFATVTGITGVGLLAFGANELTAVLGAFNLALYTCMYTPLKRRTIANTWVGSIVGGIPPIMGWAACTGELSHGALLLGLILYAWQFPHFNALSWNIRKDYDKAGYKMMAISHPDLCKTTSLRYSLGIVAMSSLAPVCNVTSWTFVVDSLPVNGYLVYLAYQFYKDGDSASSRKLFRYTLIHLPILIMLMMISKKNYKENDAPCPVSEAAKALEVVVPPPHPTLLS